MKKRIAFYVVGIMALSLTIGCGAISKLGMEGTLVYAEGEDDFVDAVIPTSGMLVRKISLGESVKIKGHEVNVVYDEVDADRDEGYIRIYIDGVDQDIANQDKAFTYCETEDCYYVATNGTKYMLIVQPRFTNERAYEGLFEITDGIEQAKLIDIIPSEYGCEYTDDGQLKTNALIDCFGTQQVYNEYQVTAAGFEKQNDFFINQHVMDDSYFTGHYGLIAQLSFESEQVLDAYTLEVLEDADKEVTPGSELFVYSFNPDAKVVWFYDSAKSLIYSVHYDDNLEEGYFVDYESEGPFSIQGMNEGILFDDLRIDSGKWYYFN